MAVILATCLFFGKNGVLDHLLKKAYESSIILSGISAGSICWFEEGLTDSNPGKLTKLTCLGLIKGSNCPHYDGEKERRVAYHELISSGGIKAGFAADDGVALNFINGEFCSSCQFKTSFKSLFRSENQSRR